MRHRSSEPFGGATDHAKPPPLPAGLPATLSGGSLHAPYEPHEGGLNGSTAPGGPSPSAASTGAQNGSCRTDGRRGIRFVEDGRRRVRVRGFPLVGGVLPAPDASARDAFFRT